MWIQASNNTTQPVEAAAQLEPSAVTITDNGTSSTRTSGPYKEKKKEGKKEKTEWRER